MVMAKCAAAFAAGYNDGYGVEKQAGLTDEILAQIEQADPHGGGVGKTIAKMVEHGGASSEAYEPSRTAEIAKKVLAIIRNNQEGGHVGPMFNTRDLSELLENNGVPQMPTGSDGGMAKAVAEIIAKDPAMNANSGFSGTESDSKVKNIVALLRGTRIGNHSSMPSMGSYPMQLDNSFASQQSLAGNLAEAPQNDLSAIQARTKLTGSGVPKPLAGETGPANSYQPSANQYDSDMAALLNSKYAPLAAAGGIGLAGIPAGLGGVKAYRALKAKGVI